MGAIHAFIKSYQNKCNESPVIIEYSHLKKRWRINTGVMVNSKDIGCVYDPDLETYKLTSLRKLKDAEREKLTVSNRKLNEQLQKLSAALLQLKSKSLPLTPENLRSAYSAPPKGPATEKKILLAWYNEFIATKKKEIGSGINGYRSTFEHFKVFTAKNGLFDFSDLTKQFLESFREYFVDKGLAGPTVHKQFRNLRIFLNWVMAQDENDSVTIPSAYKKFKGKARYGDPIGLTVDQFFQFYKFDLSERRALEVTRDVFAFAVSIGGPRYGDLVRLAAVLRKNGFSVNQNTITYFEAKTGNAHQEIILNKIGLEVLERYNFKMPEVVSNFRMNQNLKTIADLLDWTEIKYIPKYDNYGKLIRVDEVPLKDIFCTKFMRKTAATIDNVLGVPTKTSMKRTGHKTFAAFSRYVDVNKDSLSQANKQWDGLLDSILAASANHVTTVSMEELIFAN